ncbi:MAG: LacI family DNA-binding transcriptional regulator [Actinomycetota bacterium]
MAGVKEIAELAGVSTATVSRALRGMQHVNNQTREKIVAAAEKLNYPLETVLVSTRTHSVGVVAPFISNWYFSNVIHGAEHALREAALIYCSTTLVT